MEYEAPDQYNSDVEKVAFKVDVTTSCLKQL